MSQQPRRDAIDVMPPLPACTRERAIAELHKLYAQLPTVLCKGLCHDSCTAIGASHLERQLVEEAGGTLGPPLIASTIRKRVAAGHTPRCPSLGPLNNCTVYEARPFICRVWGVAEGLRCEHGCIPDGMISRDQAVRAMVEIERLSRAVTGVRAPRPVL